MTFKKIIFPLLAAVLLYWGWEIGGWQGAALVVSAGAMWLLLHTHRIIQIMRRASQRPIGFVDSAVMLHAKLKPGVTLLHVLALTRALGQRESSPDEQPEIYLWRDTSGAQVRCIFEQGRLQSWNLSRPR